MGRRGRPRKLSLTDGNNPFADLTEEMVEDVLRAQPDLFERVNANHEPDPQGEFWRLKPEVIEREAEEEASAEAAVLELAACLDTKERYVAAEKLRTKLAAVIAAKGTPFAEVAFSELAEVIDAVTLEKELQAPKG